MYWCVDWCVCMCILFCVCVCDPDCLYAVIHRAVSIITSSVASPLPTSVYLFMWPWLFVRCHPQGRIHYNIIRWLPHTLLLFICSCDPDCLYAVVHRAVSIITSSVASPLPTSVYLFMWPSLFVRCHPQGRINYNIITSSLTVYFPHSLLLFICSCDPHCLYAVIHRAVSIITSSVTSPLPTSSTSPKLLVISKWQTTSSRTKPSRIRSACSRMTTSTLRGPPRQPLT